MLNIDLHLLRIFLAVYETRSATRAADRLGMSQPGLSTAIGRLRELLGDQIFIRTSSGLSPTRRARDLHELIRSVVDTLDKNVLMAPEFAPSESQREFSIALSDVGEAIYMPLAIGEFGRIAPHASLRSVSTAPDLLAHLMEEGVIDCAAGFFPDLPAQRFLRRRIGLHSFACLLRTDHPIKGERIRSTEFAAARHVVVEAHGRSQEVFETFLRAKGLERTVVLRTPHFMSLPMIISSTDLIATVPQALADFFQGSYGLRQVRLPFRPPVFEANLYWSKTMDLSAENVWLRHTLMNAFSVIKARAYERNGR